MIKPKIGRKYKTHSNILKLRLISTKTSPSESSKNPVNLQNEPPPIFDKKAEIYSDLCFL